MTATDALRGVGAAGLSTSGSSEEIRARRRCMMGGAARTARSSCAVCFRTRQQRTAARAPERCVAPTKSARRQSACLGRTVADANLEGAWLEFFLFDFGSRTLSSPHGLIREASARTGAQFTYLPVLLGGIFNSPATRLLPPPFPDQEGRLMRLWRRARFVGITRWPTTGTIRPSRLIALLSSRPPSPPSGRGSSRLVRPCLRRHVGAWLKDDAPRCFARRSWPVSLPPTRICSLVKPPP